MKEIWVVLEEGDVQGPYGQVYGVFESEGLARHAALLWEGRYGGEYKIEKHLLNDFSAWSTAYTSMPFPRQG